MLYPCHSIKITLSLPLLIKGGGAFIYCRKIDRKYVTRLPSVTTKTIFSVDMATDSTIFSNEFTKNLAEEGLLASLLYALWR
jgi:hypothetical protein